MLITFVGSPCSGKTTAAALAFAKLKDHGFVIEFIPEQARQYIIERRLANQLKSITLTTPDQLAIMQRQLEAERIALASLPDDSLVLTDSSTLNTLLYLPEEERKSPRVQKLIEISLKNNPLIFYCPPVNPPNYPDPNRLHSQEEALRIDSSLKQVISAAAPAATLIDLYGDSRARCGQVVSTVLSKI